MFNVVDRKVEFAGFTWFSSLFLSSNVLQPVLLVEHVVSSDMVEPEKFVDGVRVRPHMKVLCGETVSGDFGGKVPDFTGIEELVIKVDLGEKLHYRSYCRSCLVQASFITGVHYG